MREAAEGRGQGNTYLPHRRRPKKRSEWGRALGWTIATKTGIPPTQEKCEEAGWR